MFDRVKLGLALGAGGARGLAHIGVLKALERAGISVSFLAGSSIGAVVGAAWAAAGSVAEVEKRLMEFLATDLFEHTGMTLMRDVFHNKPEGLPQRFRTWLKKAYLQAKIVSKGNLLEPHVFLEMIGHFVPDINIEDLPVPFRALGTDLRSGRAVVFNNGSLREAVYASAAIPGVVRPLARNDLLVVDGGVVNMVPVLPVRYMGADAVLAVDVEKLINENDKYEGVFDLFFRVEDVTNYYLKELQLRQADMVVRPKVGHIHWSDFKQAAEMIQLGQDEAALHFDSIKALTRRRKRPWWMFANPPPKPARDWIEV